ncbi:MAG TPA: hypothetical protein VFY56_01255 [Propionibacteriaceae bacterium]|nr:hypothetical protein [Propionibacteriaceae bacterium]
MQLGYQILVLLHLIGFAALFGGIIVQLRSKEPEVNAAMLHGSLTLLITGLALVTLQELGPDPVNHIKIGIKLAITAILVLLVVKNRKFASIPRGLWGLLGVLTIANAAVAVLWQ